MAKTDTTPQCDTCHRAPGHAYLVSHSQRAAGRRAMCKPCFNAALAAWDRLAHGKRAGKRTPRRLAA